MNLFHCFFLSRSILKLQPITTIRFLQPKRPRISLGKYQFRIYTKAKPVTLGGLRNFPPSLQVMLGICIEILQFQLFKTPTHSPCIIALPPYVSRLMDPGMVFDHHVRTEVAAEVTMKTADSWSALKLIAADSSKMSETIHQITRRHISKTAVQFDHSSSLRFW